MKKKNVASYFTDLEPSLQNISRTIIVRVSNSKTIINITMYN